MNPILNPDNYTKHHAFFVVTGLKRDGFYSKAPIEITSNLLLVKWNYTISLASGSQIGNIKVIETVFGTEKTPLVLPVAIAKKPAVEFLSLPPSLFNRSLWLKNPDNVKQSKIEVWEWSSDTLPNLNGIQFRSGDNVSITNNNNMSIGYPPQSIPQANGESITTLNATSVSPQTFAANSSRVSGYILNFANRAASVIFGTGTPVAGASNTTPIPAAVNGAPGSIDLPDDFDGPIQIIWASGVSTTTTAVLHEMI